MQTVETISIATTRETAKRRSAWLVVGVSSVGLFFHLGSLAVNAFGVMLKTLCEQFHWDREEVSFAFTLMTLTAMLAMPLTGWLTDRIGSRRPILICLAAFGALYASLTFLTPSLWHLYAVFLAVGLVGPGTSAVPHASLISRWFTDRRGLALGLAMSGTAIGGVIWPSATQKLMNWFGWRNAYAISGGAALLVAVPLLILFLREPSKPAQLPEQSGGGEKPDGLTRREALGGSLLWLMLFAFFIISLSIHACMIHFVAMLTDRKMTPESAAFASTLMGAAGMIARLGMGYLLDKLPAERVPSIAFCVVAAGIFLLFAGATGWSAYFAAILIGIGYGSETATVPYLIGRYFGLRSFGEIYSYLFIAVPFGGALGPWLMAKIFVHSGSYQLGLLFCGVATVVAAILLLRLSSYPVHSKK
jgi:MFS family permease